MLVQVTRVLALILSGFGLNGPPPPAIVMPALPLGVQPGEGLGLTDGLGLTEGLGLTDGLGEGLTLGDGLTLGLGLGVTPVEAACVALAVRARRNKPRIAVAHFFQSGGLTDRVLVERVDGWV